MFLSNAFKKSNAGRILSIISLVESFRFQFLLLLLFHDVGVVLNVADSVYVC